MPERKIITEDIEIVSLISKIVANHMKFKSSIKRSPKKYADKRQIESTYMIKPCRFEYLGHTYDIEYIVDCSGYTIYARGLYYKDGVRTNLTSLKNILAQLAAKGVLIV